MSSRFAPLALALGITWGAYAGAVPRLTSATGPAATGPATTGSATTGPATTGSATTGPATTGPAAMAIPATLPLALGLTVAILDFKADLPANPEFGQQIAETLVATLTGEPGYLIVDRSSLTRVLQEHELALTGLVNTDQALKVGKLVGAKLLVTGKVFSLDKQVFITAKVIGVETSLVEGVLVKGEKDADAAALVMQLADRVSKKLTEAGPRLVANNADAFDPLPALKEKLRSRRLPKVAVRISERHLAEVRAATADPAVETEVRKILIEAGLTVVDGDEKDWARAGLEVGITGEGFSEPAARIGNLVTCTDRVEIKVTNFKDGTLRLVDRDTNRAVDLTENLAAKTAMQKSGRVIGIHVLEHLAATIPAK